MLSDLKKHYLKLIAPTISLFLIFGASEIFQFSDFNKLTPPSFFPVLFFILSSITAIAGPLFLRTLFAHFMRDKKQVPINSFIKFEKGLISISLLTPFFAFIAIVCEFDKFYSTSIILFSFYAVYYYFPAKKRIDFDKKIFRINEEF
ncbi:MAG: hypothetical protein KAR45_00665 [Desulfobacteraceae bacterium]|nr:hypothetical protein [Desulfobacteraceae bacterium]